MTRKNLFKLTIIAMTAIFSMTFIACSDDDDDNAGNVENAIANNFLTIQESNAKYNKTDLPDVTSNEPIASLNMNQNAMPGGSSVITLTSKKEISELYLSVKGIPGYLSFTPILSSTANRSDISYIYTVILSFNQKLSADFNVTLMAKAVDGAIHSIFKDKELSFTHAGSGSLQVSLSFDQLKDVDLYLVLPNSDVICYNNPTVKAMSGDSIISAAELDVDSNADCYIDSINNENIFFKEGFSAPGKYKVYINMYHNCEETAQAPTNCVVLATYQGKAITPSAGIGLAKNPALYTFSANEPSHGNQEVLLQNTEAVCIMEFEIPENPVNRSDNDLLIYTNGINEKLKLAK